ncbi:MAG: pyruvate formate lyase family protein [Candidatus Cloacimonetes bacterium]|nr:pyruvate formate lyase family protein [Candidatus Cloacimonadota bacterium]
MERKADFIRREVQAQPSTQRISQLRQAYLSSPLHIDLEYIDLYTTAHQASDGFNPLERRAFCHAHALENLSPQIREGELLVGAKTRFVRGAIPYLNYACQFVIRELNREAQEAQDKFTDIGTGGGIDLSAQLAKAGKYEMFGKKFLISRSDKEKLNELAYYWQGRCMQDESDRVWKESFPQAEFIENGWQMGLYTAPHDPAPEGRFVLDFETALSEGLLGVIARAQKQIELLEITDFASSEKLYFYRAGIRVLEAAINWARNHAKQAKKLAKKEQDTFRKAELLNIAEICGRVPAHAPQSFREAMQAWWFIYLAGHLEGAHLGYSPGRFDRYMYPYFKKDIEAGKITRDEALELLEALRIKLTEIEYMASFSWEGLGSGNLYQNMILGGMDENGHPADNELSILVLQSAINCQTTQPTLSIWYDDRASDAFLMKAIDCVKTGVGFPAFFNTKIYLQHELEKSKLPLATIRKYAAMGGCTEPTLEGMSYGIVQAGFINHAKVFELAMNGGKDPCSGIELHPCELPQNPAQLKENYLYLLQLSIRYWQRYWNYVMAAHRNSCNLIYCSMLVRDCIGHGKSLDDGGAIINGSPTTLSSGMVNVVNSFAAVNELIDTKAISGLEELRRALKDNWEGYSGLHKKALAAPKWGNNDSRADLFYEEFFNKYCDFVAEQKNYLGEPYDPSMLAISTHAPFGKACGATPDGRIAHQTLADGVTSPFPGTDVSGPTAVLLSAGKIDHTRIRGGLHNMKFLPSSIQGASGSRKLLSLIKTYFDTLGFQIQFNVVDSRMLRSAQEKPEEYRDLIVRVAGFSAFFVELGKSMQDEIIARTEHRL